MDDNSIRDLRALWVREDFKHLWLRIATHIKIRRFNGLTDTPEFRTLPNKLLNEINSNMNTVNYGYKPFYSEESYHMFHVMLFTNEKEKWIAIFQETGPSANIRALLITIGIGSFFFILKALSPSNSVKEQNNGNYTESVTYSSLGTNSSLRTNSSLETINASNNPESYFWNSFPGMVLSVMASCFVFFASRYCLTARDAKYNKLVQACMLKKLESISSSQ